jgi:F-type H+-transporting ATPase subunit alpha
VELFKQVQYNPLPVEEQAALIWAMQNGFFDDVPVAKLKEFQLKLQDFLTTRKASLLKSLEEKKAFDDAISAELKAAVTEFKTGYKP